MQVTTGAPWSLRISRTQFDDARIDADEPLESVHLAAGEVLLQIERFALTASNITYAAFGEYLYWKLFPAPEGMGKLPVWGFAQVVKSAASGLEVGQRIRGCLPLASHMRMQAKVEAKAVFDIAPHRAQLPPFYNQYALVGATARALDDYSVLLPFGTSFALDDFVTENRAFAAGSVMLTSASSKTALGTACLLQRRGMQVIGITSQAHHAFVRSAGYYDRVLGYDEVDTAELATPLLIVDFAGNADVLRSLHQRFADRITYTCCVGRTHWQASSDLSGLPGPEPKRFFAPDWTAHRMQQLGREHFGAQYAAAWNAFSDDAPRWLNLRHHQGPEQARTTYLAILAGTAEPSEGHIIQL